MNTKGKSLKEIRHDMQCYRKETIYDATDDKRKTKTKKYCHKRMEKRKEIERERVD